MRRNVKWIEPARATGRINNLDEQKCEKIQKSSGFASE